MLQHFWKRWLKRKQETNSEAVFCFGNKIINKKITPHKANYTEESQISTFLATGGYFHLSATLFAKKLLTDNGILFKEEMRLAEDILFTLELLNSTQFYCMPERLFSYYKRENSATNKKWEKDDWLHEIDAWKLIYNYLLNTYNKPDQNLVLRQVKATIANRELSYLVDLLKNFKYKDVKEYIKNHDSINTPEFLTLIENTSDMRKLKYTSKNNMISLFLGAIYYRYLR